jgi:predicted restriction endonuclease
VFRVKQIQYWGGCAATGASQREMLIASHIKPWSMSSDLERLDVYNGFLFTPNIDRAFDKGLISFGEMGQVLISTQLQDPESFGINKNFTLKLESRHRYYLKFHREYVFDNT